MSEGSDVLDFLRARFTRLDDRLDRIERQLELANGAALPTFEKDCLRKIVAPLAPSLACEVTHRRRPAGRPPRAPPSLAEELHRRRVEAVRRRRCRNGPSAVTRTARSANAAAR
jgi:hypothetical protein